jgi:phosphopantetheine adenylyltransferase
VRSSWSVLSYVDQYPGYSIVMEGHSIALLLLPPPPSQLSPINTKAAYGPAIHGALNHVTAAKTPRLDIAMAVPASWLETQDVSRTALFEKAQKALAQIYGLVCGIAASQGIELDCLAGLDARVFFLLPARGSSGDHSGGSDEESSFSGPWVNLTTLIDSRRAYETLIGVESEEGERLLKAFTVLYQTKHRHSPFSRRVPGGLCLTNPSNASPSMSTSHRAHFSVAVGGTFDHLHIGHKLLLTATALLAEPKGSQQNPSQTVHLTIGISGDKLLTKKKFAEQLEGWDQRQQKVAEFLESVIAFSAAQSASRKIERIAEPDSSIECVRATFGSSIMIDYVAIMDPFGPTITDENISALVVSQETRSGGSAINEKRKEKGWIPLDVFEIDVLEINAGDSEERNANPSAATFESKISSTEIRRRIHDKRVSAK